MSNFTKNLSRVIEALGGYAAAATASKLKSTQTFYNWEKKPPQQFSNLLELADASGVSVDWLLGRPGATKDFTPGGGAPVAPARLVAPNELNSTTLTAIAADANDAIIDIPIWRSDANPARAFDYMRFRSSYLDNRLHIPTVELVLVPVSTQSAEPTLMKGGVCICHTAADIASGIWAVAQKGATKAEFRNVILRENNRLLISSLAAYSEASYPTTITAFKRFCIGKVVWGGERFFN